MMYRWRISFEILSDGEEAGNEHEIDVDAVATNAPDAFIAAITFVRQSMQPRDDFHMIHVSRREETSINAEVEIPVAWFADEGRD